MIAEISETEGPLRLSTARPPTRAYFLKFIAANPDLRTELTAEIEMIVMAPAHSRSGHQNAALTAQLFVWALQDGYGQAYDSSTGYDLPDGSNRSPDASWVTKSRLALLSDEERDDFLPLCPDFVIELRPKSDSVRMLRNKMTEYISNGARLGWLIDPFNRSVHIYRPHTPVQFLEEPAMLSGDPELPGFVLNLQPIFNPEF